MSEQNPAVTNSGSQSTTTTSTPGFVVPQHATSPAIDIPSTSNRPTSPDGPLPLWIAGASPVKFFTVDELLRVNSTLEKMVLAHEIAVDPNFSLDKLPKDPLEEQVKKVMHDAFWDKVKESFSQNPPDYQHAFTLVVDLKEMMIGLLTDQQIKFRELIEDGINLPVLKQQVEHGIFEFNVLRFVMELLGKLCAPIRDEQLQALKDETDMIKQLRGIFEFIEVLKMDLANFTVTKNRSTIEKYAAEYEHDQFLKVLEIDPTGNVGIRATLKRILQDYLDENRDTKKQTQLTGLQVKELIVEFYMTLLENPDDVQKFPETLKIDEGRIKALSEKFLQLVLVLANIFVASNVVGRDICESTNYKAELKKDLLAILNDVDKSNESTKIENAALQCISKSEGFCGPNKFTADTASTMKHRLLDLENEDNSIRKIARDRIYRFIKEIIMTGGNNPGQVQLPRGLSVIAQELGALTGRYLQLALHNWRAFGVYYGTLLEQEFGQLKQ